MTAPARWPALLDRQAMAEYLSCSVATVLAEVARGRLPEPIRQGGRDKWFRDAVDQHLARLAGGADDLPDYRRRFKEGRRAA